MTISHSLPIDQNDNQGVLPTVRYFPFLGELDTILNSKNNYLSQRKIGKTTCVEIKCSHDQDWNFTLQHKRTTFWISFQLLGESSISTESGSKIEQQQYSAFYNIKKKTSFEIKKGKTWLLLIGLKIDDIEPFVMEWRSLHLSYDTKFKLFPKVNIGYRIKSILAKIQRTRNSCFSLRYKLSPLVIQLIETFHGDLIEQSKSLQQADVSLFHRAKEYIIAHYMDEDISIEQMVSELRTSRRTLFRVFKENGLTINSAIQSIRIYKGREMLRRTDLSVDMIAFHLQFASAKYFIKQYVKYFGHTPNTERQLKQRPSLSKRSTYK